MTVVGNEQRIYGVLTSSGDCYIWLHRFAVCVGTQTLPPDEFTGTILYGDTDANIKNCGHLYTGYLSILFITGSYNTRPHSVFEVRRCATGKEYIFIGTYDDEGSYEARSLWFNQSNDDDEPDWILLNSGSLYLHSYTGETRFAFRENHGKKDTYNIDCCKQCADTCMCLLCNVNIKSRLTATGTIDGYTYNFGFSYYLNYGYTGNGIYTFLSSDDVFVEYRMTCDTIEFWVGDYEDHIYDYVIRYTDDLRTSHLLATLPAAGSPTSEVAHFTFDFDYIAYCATNSITISGCQTISFPYTLPLNASLWNFTRPAIIPQLEATLNSTPVSRCFDSTTYSDFTWELNYGALPSVTASGKIVSHDYCNDFEPFITFPVGGGSAPGFTSKTFNVHVQSGDIYKVKTPKYLEKTTNSCIVLSGSMTSQKWFTLHGGRGYEINGMACAFVGRFETSGGIISLTFTTSRDPDAIHIISYGIDYWVRIGFLVISTGLGMSGGYAGGNIYSNGVASFLTEYGEQYRLVNSDITSVTGSFGIPRGGRGCVVGNTIYSSYLTLNGNYPWDGCYIHTYNATTGAETTGPSPPIRSEFIWGSHGSTAVMMPVNGDIWVFQNQGQSYIRLSDGRIFDNSKPPIELDPSIHFTIEGPATQIQHFTLVEHNGKLYCAGMPGHRLLVYDEGSHIFRDTGIQLGYYGICLISYGDYLIGISNSADSQPIPQIDIIPNSMLP